MTAGAALQKQVSALQDTLHLFCPHLEPVSTSKVSFLAAPTPTPPAVSAHTPALSPSAPSRGSLALGTSLHMPLPPPRPIASLVSPSHTRPAPVCQPSPSRLLPAPAWCSSAGKIPPGPCRSCPRSRPPAERPPPDSRCVGSGLITPCHRSSWSRGTSPSHELNRFSLPNCRSRSRPVSL